MPILTWSATYATETTDAYLAKHFLNQDSYYNSDLNNQYPVDETTCRELGEGK